MNLCNRYRSNWMVMVKVKKLHLNEIGLTPPLYRIFMKKIHYRCEYLSMRIVHFPWTFHGTTFIPRLFSTAIYQLNHQHPFHFHFHFHLHCTSADVMYFTTNKISYVIGSFAHRWLQFIGGLNLKERRKKHSNGTLRPMI